MGGFGQRNMRKFGTSGFKNMPVYIMIGKNDIWKILDSTVDYFVNYFKNLGANVKLEHNDYGHTYANALPDTPWNRKGKNPKDPNAGYINCNDDLAGRYLNHIFGKNLNPWNLKFNSNGQLYMIDQTPYIDSASKMFKYGYIYIPDKCLNADCPVHIAFHGCAGSAIVT